jgi:hypothetical protein
MNNKIHIKVSALVILAVSLCNCAILAAADEVPVVMIASKENAEEFQRTYDAVLGQVSDLPVALVIEWVDFLAPDLRSQVELARKWATRNSAATVFWVDLSKPDRVFLYFAQPTGERVLVREVGAVGGSEEGRLETFATIVRTGIKAVLEGGEIGIHPKEITQEEPPIEQEIKKILEAEASYLLAPYADDNKWIHGPRLGLSVYLVKWLRFFAAYRIIFPLNLKNDHVSLQLQSHPIEAGFGVRLRTQSWSFDMGASFLANYMTTETETSNGQVILERIGNLWLWGVSPSVGVGWSPSKFATIFLSISVDCVFNQPEYVFTTPNGSETIIYPWSVRPLLQLGGIFSML